jgi:hypothetical protein
MVTSDEPQAIASNRVSDTRRFLGCDARAPMGLRSPIDDGISAPPFGYDWRSR